MPADEASLAAEEWVIPLTPEEETRLVERLRKRDEAAFNLFVRTYQNRVFALVHRMLGNRAEAEDLAQEVFVTVFKSIDLFRGDSRLGTWLYRVAVNHCKNRMKYLDRRRTRAHGAIDDARESDVSDGSAIGGRLPRPDEAMAGAQLEGAIQTALAELDEEHRVLIVLRDLEGLAYEEIQRITGLPDGTVKSRLHRARAALRDAVERGVGWKLPE